MVKHSEDRATRSLMRTRRALPGASPGTLVVDPDARQSVIKVIRYSPDTIEELVIESVAEIPAPTRQLEVIWVNVDGLGDTDLLRALGDKFEIHGLALEDVINVHQRPKSEDHDHYLFVVNRMPWSSPEGAIETEQVSFFLMDRLLISFQEKPGDCFEPVRNRLRAALGRIRQENADYLLYALLDAMTDSYYPILERYGDRVEDLNELVIAQTETVTPAEFHRIRRDLMTLRRAIFPLREMFAALIRDPPRFIGETTTFYLRDCHDHAIQLLDFVETYREIASGSIELYMSSANNRLNEVIKVLTIIATIFIPLGFIASLYGMNFDTSVSPWNMPELKWVLGYPFALGLMLAVILVLLIYFRRKGWIGQTRARRK